jgi:acyl CoA:acetate/3-ketoacid CoA transferase beta subunit
VAISNRAGGGRGITDDSIDVGSLVEAAGVVNRVVTNLGLFEVTDREFLLIEPAPGYSAEEIRAVTEGQMLVSDELMEFRLA